MKKLIIAIVALGLMTPALSHAQTKGFIGGSLGASFYDTSVEDVSTEDFKLEGEEFAWKIFGGVRTMTFIGLEGGYVHFGKVQNQTDNFNVESKTTGWDVFATGNIPLGSINLFGKAGYLWWRADVQIDEAPFETTDGDFMWGLGATLQLGGLGIRAEFERVEMGDSNSLMLLTAGVTFGS